MSCHDIGHCVDFIIQNVLDMYEHGEISKEAALKMIRTLPQAVHYCDGNESEALEYLTDNYCCGCLHEYEDDEIFVTVDDIYNANIELGEFRSPYEVWDAPQENGAFYGYSLCLACFRKFFSEILHDEFVEKICEAADSDQS